MAQTEIDWLNLIAWVVVMLMVGSIALQFFYARKEEQNAKREDEEIEALKQQLAVLETAVKTNNSSLSTDSSLEDNEG